MKLTLNYLLDLPWYFKPKSEGSVKYYIKFALSTNLSSWVNWSFKIICRHGKVCIAPENILLKLKQVLLVKYLLPNWGMGTRFPSGRRDFKSAFAVIFRFHWPKRANSMSSGTQSSKVGFKNQKKSVRKSWVSRWDVFWLESAEL